MNLETYRVNSDSSSPTVGFGRPVFFDKHPAPFTTPEQPIDITQKLRELVKSAYLEGSRVQEFYGAADWEKSHTKEILDSLGGGE